MAIEKIKDGIMVYFYRDGPPNELPEQLGGGKVEVVPRIGEIVYLSMSREVLYVVTKVEHNIFHGKQQIAIKLSEAEYDTEDEEGG